MEEQRGGERFNVIFWGGNASRKKGGGGVAAFMGKGALTM